MINNAFGGVYVDQSDTVKIRKTNIDVDIADSFNKTYSSTYESTRTTSIYKNVDIDVDIYKKSVRVAAPNGM